MVGSEKTILSRNPQEALYNRTKDELRIEVKNWKFTPYFLDLRLILNWRCGIILDYQKADIDIT